MAGGSGVVATGPSGAAGPAPAPAEEADVAAAEAALGFRLPPALRQYYLQVADGGVGPGNGVYGLAALVAEHGELTADPVGPQGQPWPEHLLPVQGEGWDIVALDRDTGRLVFWDLRKRRRPGAHARPAHVGRVVRARGGQSGGLAGRLGVHLSHTRTEGVDCGQALSGEGRLAWIRGLQDRASHPPGRPGRGPVDGVLRRDARLARRPRPERQPQLRFVQVTPPGSACSICSGAASDHAGGVVPVHPGRRRRRGRRARPAACPRRRVRGRREQPWGRFVHFADPDGNRWALQQLVRPS